MSGTNYLDSKNHWSDIRNKIVSAAEGVCADNADFLKELLGETEPSKSSRVDLLCNLTEVVKGQLITDKPMSSGAKVGLNLLSSRNNNVVIEEDPHAPSDAIGLTRGFKKLFDLFAIEISLVIVMQRNKSLRGYSLLSYYQTLFKIQAVVEVWVPHFIKGIWDKKIRFDDEKCLENSEFNTPIKEKIKRLSLLLLLNPWSETDHSVQRKCISILTELSECFDKEFNWPKSRKFLMLAIGLSQEAGLAQFDQKLWESLCSKLLSLVSRPELIKNQFENVIERMSISEMQFEEIQRFGQDYESDKVMFDVLASLRSLEGEPQQDQKDSVEALKKAFRSAISSLVEVFKSTRPSATMQIQDEEAIKSEGGDSALIQALYQQGCGYLVDCFAMSFIRAGIQKSVVWSEAYAKYFQEMFDQLLSDDPKNIKTQIRAHFTTARKFNSEFRTEEYAGGELAFKLVLHGINNPGDERKCLEVLTVLFEFASSWKHKEWVGHLKECAIFLLVLGGDVDSEFGLPKIPSLYNDLKWPKVLINSLLNEVPRSKEVNFFLGLLKQAALPYLSSDQIQTQIAHFHDLGSKHYVNSYPVSRECEERLHRFARRHTELLNNNEGLNNFPHPTRSFELTLSNAAFLAEYVELLLYPQEKQAFSQRPLGHFYMPFLQTRSSFEEVMKDLVELFRWAGNAGDFKESALRALNLFLNHIEGQIKEVFGLSLENGKTLIEELLVICTHSKFGFDLMPGFLRELNRPKYEDQLYLVVYRFGLFLLNTYETAKKVFAEFIQVLAEIRQPKALLTTLIDILLTESDALSKMYRLFSSNEARGFPLNDASKNSIVALFKKHLKPGDWAECLEVFIKTLHVVELNFKEKKAWALALLQVEHGVPFSAVPDDFKDSIFFQVGVHEGRIAWKDVPDQIRQRIKVALLNSPMSSGKENRVVSIGGHGKNPQFFVMNKHGKIKGPISMVKHEEIKGPEKMRESPPRRDAHSPVQSKKISGVAAFDLSVEALRSLENPVSLPSPDPEAVKDAVEKLKARGLIMEDPLFYPSLDEPCPAPGFLSGVSMPFAGACLTHPASPQQGQQSLCVKKTQGSRSGQPKKPWARNKCMPIKPRGDLFLFKNIKFDALAEGELPENFDFSASPT